jgi:type IV secretion system protein VirB6
MTVFCEGPDPAQGVALRLSQYVACEARVLGENGFQALAGGPLGMSLLSGLVTIFIGLIGYRMLLGSVPGIRDGVGWAVRLGIVLALVTSWPAFQTLVYRVAVDGPLEVAGIILPASGLPSTDLSGRVQNAYDTLRLGTVDVGAAQPPSQPQVGTFGSSAPHLIKFQSPLPNTASVLVISTLGVIAALQIAIGFLLAVAPLALMSILFQGTIGLFNGWLRALAGAALTMLAATIVTAVDLVLVESELGRLQRFQVEALSDFGDPQALTTIVALFAFVMLVLVAFSMKMASALKLSPSPALTSGGRENFDERTPLARVMLDAGDDRSPSRAVENTAQTRVATVAEVLTRTMQREHAASSDMTGGPSRPLRTAERIERSPGRSPSDRLGAARRKSFDRRTTSTARRDQRT